MIRPYVAFLCFLALSLAAPSLPRRSSESQGRIVGGTAANISDYPWQVSLQDLGTHRCGASIISASWGLTAAHCVRDGVASSTSIRAGTSMRGSGGVVLSASAVIPHPEYTYQTIDCDVGVVQVIGSFPTAETIQAVNLPSDGFDPPDGLAVTVTGWGDVYSGGEPPLYLQKVEISVFDRAACQGIFGNIRNVTANMVCAGQAGQSVCHGDSGGPLVSGSTQVGVVSWGSPECVDTGAVYANVGSLRPWIRNTTGV